MHTLKEVLGARVEYLPFKPSEEIEDAYPEFWKINKNLIQGEKRYSRAKINEIQQRPKVTHKRLCITGVEDFIGLEEVMMKNPKRFTKVECTSKYAKVVKINAIKLFKKLNDAEMTQHWEIFAQMKLSIVSKAIEDFTIFEKKMVKKKDREDQIKISDNPTEDVIQARDVYNYNIENLFKKNIIKRNFHFQKYR